MISTILLTTTILLFVYALYKKLTENDDYFNKKGVPFIKRKFFLRNLFSKKMSAQEKLIKQYNSFPEARYLLRKTK